jgi:hypothetical protein
MTQAGELTVAKGIAHWRSFEGRSFLADLFKCFDSLFCDLRQQQIAEESREGMDMPPIVSHGPFLFCVSLQVDVCPPGKRHAQYLVLVEVFLEGIPVLILCPLRPGRLQAIPSRPDTPDTLPVLQPDIEGARPLAGGGLVASFVEMFFDAFLFHAHCSFPWWSTKTHHAPL